MRWRDAAAFWMGVCLVAGFVNADHGYFGMVALDAALVVCWLFVWLGERRK